MTPVGLHCKLEGVPPPPLAQRIALGLMHATPVATPFHRPGWVYEEKVDGYRMAALGASLEHLDGLDPDIRGKLRQYQTAPPSSTSVYSPRGGWPKYCSTSKAPAKSSLLSSPPLLL